MGNAFQTSSELGVGLPPGSFVADDEDALVGIASITRGNPDDEELAAVTAVLLGLRAVMAEEPLVVDTSSAWGAASVAEHIRQAPLISAADPRLNARSSRAWFSRR